MKRTFSMLLASAAALMLATAGASAEDIKVSGPVYDLTFNPKAFTVKTLTVGDQTITYRAFEKLVYVKNPVDAKYECMNFYVPEAYYSGKSIGTYTAATAPIFFPNGIGGYMPAEPGSPENTGFAGIPPLAAGAAPPTAAADGGAMPTGAGMPGRSGPNAIFTALSKGFVVAAPGSRGRTVQDGNGLYTGKAPACIVDLKAAIRYLRLNDKEMPGNAERIVSNGTSAGGAVSALVGATGNNPEYESYLKALGAADGRDDVFAASCYCPITNLDNADMAYEWQFNGLNGYSTRSGNGTMTAEQIRASGELKKLFPAYLNGLDLKQADGTPLTVDAEGNGTFKDYIASLLVASAQKALEGGTDLSGKTWLTVKGGKVTGIDFEEYIAFIGRMKATPAFDPFDASSAECSLFGTPTVNVRHFTEFSLKRGSVGAPVAEAALVKLMNPMYYIGDKETTTAKYWRIRHGASDRDASFPIAVMLASKLRNNGSTVDLALPWGQGHGGDYDLEELFAWMSQVCK